jgi:ketosteroid isomerase-like protein
MSSETTTAEAMEAAVHAYFDGINEERYDDVGRLFADDAVLMAPGVPPRRGPEEIAAYFGRALARYPEHYDDPTRLVIADRTVTVEISYRGALANGTPITFEAVDVFDFDEHGKIKRLTTWYDSFLVRSRLADAEAGEAPPAEERERLGSLAEATPARTRRAMRELRDGRAVALGASARWTGLPADAVPVAARAVFVDVSGTDAPGAADVASALEQARATVQGGDALLVRTGGRRIAFDALPLEGVVAVATDGALDGRAPAGLAYGEGWDLAAVAEAFAGRRGVTGLLVSVPSTDGAALALWV